MNRAQIIDQRLPVEVTRDLPTLATPRVRVRIDQVADSGREPTNDGIGRIEPDRLVSSLRQIFRSLRAS